MLEVLEVLSCWVVWGVEVLRCCRCWRCWGVEVLRCCRCWRCWGVEVLRCWGVKVFEVFEVLLFFEIQIFVTAFRNGIVEICKLWIAFVLWNSDICHSCCHLIIKSIEVVNCFCSLKFRYLSQQKAKHGQPELRCELLLFFEIQIFVTASSYEFLRVPLLWIAFVLWNSDICHSWTLLTLTSLTVVNCFCSLKFRYLSQPINGMVVILNSCELLLFFEIQIFVTAFHILPIRNIQLWIAFVLWNSDICHSTANIETANSVVVNCFCSLKFRYLSQRRSILVDKNNSCELLLFFEIQIFVTATYTSNVYSLVLWIAFVLWNSDICHSDTTKLSKNINVVNCFCSLKFRYLSQPVSCM